LPFPWPSSLSPTSCSTAEFSASSFTLASSTVPAWMLLMPPAANLAEIAGPQHPVSVRSRPLSRLLRFPPALARKAWPCPPLSGVSQSRASCPKLLQL
jgi:hypothetical protein